MVSYSQYSGEEMNKAFKVVWNSLRRQFVVVNEVQKSRSKSHSKSMTLTQVSLAVLAMLGASASYAALDGNATTSDYGFLIKNQQSGVTDYSNDENIKDGNLAGTKYALFSTGSDVETYIFRPELTLTADYYVVVSQSEGITHLGTDTNDTPSVANNIFITNVSETPSVTNYGILTQSSGKSYLTAQNSVQIQTNSGNSSYGIFNISSKSVTQIQTASLTVNASGSAASSVINKYGTFTLNSDKVSLNSSAKNGLATGISTYYTPGTSTISDATEVSIVSSSDGTSYATDTEVQGSLSIDSKYVKISSTGVFSAGVFDFYKSTTSIKADTVEIESSGKTSDNPDAVLAAYGVDTVGASATVIGKQITITAQGPKAYGALSEANPQYKYKKEDGSEAIGTYTLTSELNIGDSTTKNLTIQATDEAIIAWAFKPTSVLNIQAENIVLTSTVSKGNELGNYGILVQSNTQKPTTSSEYPSNPATLNIKSTGNISIESNGTAISAFSNGILNIEGNVSIKGDRRAIYTRGYATTNINTTGNGTTVIDGDIVFGTPNSPENGNNSGEKIDAYVNIRLNGSESSWTGSSYSLYNISKTETVEHRDYGSNDDYHGDVENFRLTLANGATWNANGNSFVNYLTIEGTGNTIEGNNHTLDIRNLIFEDGSQLITQLNTVYSDIKTESDVLVGATATYKDFVDVKGTASLVIEDKLTYSVAGLTALTEGYSQLNVILENASLYVDPTDVSEPITISEGTTIKLLAKGADTDVASGATLKIEGAVHVINDGTTTEAKLGTAEVKAGGSLQVETNVAAEEIKLNEGAQLNIGNNNVAGKLSAEKLTIAKGSKVFLDPTWENGQESSEAAFNLADNKLDGQLVIGQNSKAEIGSTDTAELEAALKTIGKTVSENGIKAIAYINKAVELGASGALIVDGDLTTAPDDTTGVNVAKDSALVVNAAVGADGTAIITGSTGSFTVAGTLYLDNVTADQSITVATGFKDVTVADVQAVNRLLTVTADIADGTIKLGTTTNSALINSTIAPNTLNAAVAGATGTGADRIAALFDATNGTSDTAAAKSFDSIALMGTASAAQAVAINAANMIADGLEQHGSVLASYAHDKTGADLWIDLNGSFSKAGRYQAATTTYGYKSDLAGATIGADYAFGNGAAVGGAFSFGTGSARGQGNGAGINNDIEYYGFNIYGAYSTPYVNLIGTVGYTLSKNEISQQGYKGKPDVNTFSVGIRAEKDFKVTDSFAITPHVGIRYLNVDMDNFTAGGFKYSAKKVNITEVPVGVAFNANLKAPCGADVKPFADFTIAPAMGSKKASNKFGLVGSAATDTIRSRVANSNFYQGKIGVNATQGNHSLSFSYGIGAGSDSRVDQALQAKYRYSF
jgi:hypothetical protein